MSASDDIRILQKQVYDLQTSSAALAGSSTQVFSVASPTNVAHAVPLGFFAPITNSLGADVALSNTAVFFTGPTVAQGTVGTWFVSGSVTLRDTGGNVLFVVKLWDGTTVVDSKLFNLGTGAYGVVSVSGIFVSPVGNIRISVQDATLTSGVIDSNNSGLSKDSTITAFRIG